MPRYERFTFLATGEERRVLAALARHLQRSQSDSIRLLIREAAHQLQLDAGSVAGRDQGGGTRAPP